VRGRLQQSAFPYQAMHGLILPRNPQFTNLIVLAKHVRLHHAGPQLLTPTLRENFGFQLWNLVKIIIHQCLNCYKFKAEATQRLMGELPSKRVQLPRSFLTTGVDYDRPISQQLENPCSKTITKGYIAIFVCFVTTTALKVSQVSLHKHSLLP